MTAPKLTRRVYSAEELHRLRYSQSQPKLHEAIEEHYGQDAESVKGTCFRRIAPLRTTRVHVKNSTDFEKAHLHLDCPSLSTSSVTRNMSSLSLYDINRQWVEELVTTPDRDKPIVYATTRQPKSNLPPEHILRGSKSFAARSFRSRPSANSLRAPVKRSTNENLAMAREPARQSLGMPLHVSGPVLGEIAPNSQVLRSGPFKYGPSPTPSMKKKKAEAIVKAHGSPTHVRVTAGGRIVPSEQSPLCHPRYGYSAIQINGGLVKFAPNHHAGKPQWTHATEDGFVAQDVDGNLWQIVDGTIMPLNEIDGTLKLFKHAPNITYANRGASFGASNANLTVPSAQASIEPPFTRAILSEPSLSSQISALELEYSKRESELKDVDKTEVIHGRTMSKVSKDALIARRRELVISMDKIRKALKELKSRPPPNAPTSPRAMSSKPSTSPSRNRLPPFLQMQQPQHVVLPTAAIPPNNQYFTSTSSAGQACDQRTTSSKEGFPSLSWSVPPSSMFAAPPPLDGSAAPPFALYQLPAQLGIAETQASGQIHAANVMPSDPRDSPQDDEANSMAGPPIKPPNHSRAITIRAPEPKGTTGSKQILNPLSPVYRPAGVPPKAVQNGADDTFKPIKDSTPTSLMPLHQLSPPVQEHQASTATDDTISPSKKTTHLHSSSSSSYDTADFFPRNTCEYSTRQHTYGFQNEYIEDKEINHPSQPRLPTFMPDGRTDIAAFKPQCYQSHTPHHFNSQTPIAPPGTPVDQHHDPCKTSKYTDQQIEVPNRKSHNISPKNKREWIFVQECPEQSSRKLSQTCSSNDRASLAHKSDNTIDFSEKPREWIEGYQAGLHRKPISADQMGEFLDGYCAGLLKSKASIDTPPAMVPSTSSPMKVVSRRPSPLPPSRAPIQQHLIGKSAMSFYSPIEARIESLDTLKQAVLAPQNENAILTPVPDGPHISETALNLGAWAKTQRGLPEPTAHREITPYGDVQGYFVPHRVTSIGPQPSIPFDGDTAFAPMDRALSPGSQCATETTEAHLQSRTAFGGANHLASGPVSPSLSNRSMASSSIPSGANTGRRVTSITSLDAGIHKQWPVNRIMTPSEWKTGNSIAHAAGLATGYFGNAQFDGMREFSSTLRLPGQITDGLSFVGTLPATRVGSITSAINNTERYGRFREGSLDGVNNLTGSPTAPLSPQRSPHDTPVKEGAKNKSSSPAKGSSPTKAKFEHIAGKVSIKVSAASRNGDIVHKCAEPGSPPDKRRWRDIWRKGGREGLE